MSRDPSHRPSVRRDPVAQGRRPVLVLHRETVARGTLKIAKKLGEEGVETALAAVAQDKHALTAELADLLYHLLVLWARAASRQKKSIVPWKPAPDARGWKRKCCAARQVSEVVLLARTSSVGLAVVR